MSRRKRDPRITAGSMSFSGYGVLFFILSAFNGFHMVIYQFFVSRGMMETGVQFVINVMGGYVLFMAALFMVILTVIRRLSWDRPMRTISEAAGKIAAGDFSTRIPLTRKDGRKGFVDVMYEDFNIMAQELASIETLKNDFVIAMSHEIKTPLAVIQNYAAALRDENLPEEDRRDYAGTIVQAAQKLSALTGNILKLNRLENQGISSCAVPFSLDEQLRRCVLAIEDRLEEKGLDFDADLEEVSLTADENLLEIVWNNLLSNAAKFTPPGGSIRLTLKTEAAGRPPGACAAVTIRDSGCGMDDQTMKHIYDKFYQGPTPEAAGGNGLGLALVKRALELSGGIIAVESEPGKGSAFTVRLALSPVRAGDF